MYADWYFCQNQVNLKTFYAFECHKMSKVLTFEWHKMLKVLTLIL